MSNDVQITDNADEFRNEMERKMEKALEQMGQYAEDEAKLNLERPPRRVDTGRLRNSITHATPGNSGFTNSYSDDEGNEYTDQIGQVSQDDKSAYIGTNVEYAEEIHEGRPGLDPNRFLRNAVEQNQDTYRRMIDEIMRE